MKTRVVFSKKQPHDVYIGRPSIWGNPWGTKVGARHQVGSAREAVDRYESWLRGQPGLVERARRELRGKVLGCPCGGKPCHGDVLARVADETSEPGQRSKKPTRERAPTKRQLLEQAVEAAGYDPRKNGARCDICPLAGNTIVPPNGTYEDRPVKLVIVGEGPGRKEEIQGRAFVGASGQYLNGLLRRAGIDRREAAVQNAALCRGELDKENDAAAVCCAPRLLKEIESLPKDAPIVALGKTAALSILGTKSILHARGFVWTTRDIDQKHVDDAYKAVKKSKEKGAATDFINRLRLKAAITEGRARIAGRTVFPTLHPAFVLRSDTWAPILESDLERAGRWINKTLTREMLLDHAPQFTLARRPAQIEAALRRLSDVVAVDIETDGVDPMQAKILCVGVSDGRRTVVIVHPSAKDDEPAPQWNKQDQAKPLSEFLARCKVIGMHNGYNFDQIALRRDGVVIPEEKLEDTLIAHHAFASHLPQRLAHVASVYVSSGPWKITFKRGKGEAEKGLPPQKLPMKELVFYNSVDARIQALCWLEMQADLEPEAAVYAHDKELAALCREMQIAGIRVDVERRNELTRAIRSKAAALKGKMRRIAKKPDFHPMRLREVRHILFTTLRAPMKEPTESGVPSTSSKTLEVLKESSARYGKFAAWLLAWRGAVKIRGTYLDAIPLFRNDRFHPTWKPYGTVSGRLASRIQSCPRQERDLKTREVLVETRVREVYVPRKGCAFVYFDVSQAEMRFAAHLSNDKNFINTCKGDVHTGNARIIFPDEKSLIDDPKGAGAGFRNVAKQSGFAVCYGADAEAVFQRLRMQGFPVRLSDVVRMLERIRAGYPDYYKYADSNIAWVAKHGYLRTALLGRIRWFGWHAPPTEIMNFPIQSGIADVMNARLMAISRNLLAGTRLVAQIHDACIFETPHRHVERLKRLLTDVWAEPVTLKSNGVSFVLPIDMKEGQRWSDFG